MSLEKSIKVFLNLLDSNTTNIVKDIFIFPTENKQKKLHLVVKNAYTAKTSSNFEKKVRILISDKLGKLTTFHEIWMSYFVKDIDSDFEDGNDDLE